MPQLKKSEKSQKEIEKIGSEDRLRLVIEASPSGMIMVDSKGKIVLVNSQVERLFGYDRTEILGQSIEILVPEAVRAKHPEYRNSYLKKPATRSMGAGRDLYGCTKDGQLVPVEIGLNPLALGKETFVLASVVDITERRKSELELLRSKEELERRVEERTKELAAARDQAEEVSRLKSEFLANMSHEIRTPMNAVLGMCNILSKTSLDERQQQYADNIRDGANTLLTIINDILDFSKIEAGRMKLESIDFDAVRVIESTCEMLATGARTKKLAILAEIDENIPSQLRGDPERLRQILINLISNAIKFSNQGNIIVKTKLESIQNNDAVLFISVSDEGIGIETKQLKRLFKPFEQADGSINRRFGGTGLGLSICKRLIDLMNGEIGVASTTQKGSEFWLKVPFELRSVRKPPVIAEGLRLARILIVKEDIYASQIVSKYVASWGMKSACVHSSKDAIAAMRQAYVEDQKFDIAIIDYMLPDKNGIEVAHQIFSDPAIKDTKLILLTAFDSPGLGKQALANGFNAYVTKPIRRSSLLDALTGVWSLDQSILLPQAPDGFAESAPRKTERAELILVVEDYPINQQVAQLYLEQIGFGCHMASNGVEAIQAYETNNYSLILMDCQMPIMDGYTATQKIRIQEDGSAKRIPIIALTAHAMSGDREKCLEAGMDDYLVKPIEPDHLQNMLQKWLPQTLPSYIDMSRLKSKYRDAADTLLKQFLQDGPPVLQLTTSCLQKDDQKGFQQALHGLKGISTTICAVILVERCVQIENAFYDQKWSEIPELVRILESEMTATLEFISSRTISDNG